MPKNKGKGRGVSRRIEVQDTSKPYSLQRRSLNQAALTKDKEASKEQYLQAYKGLGSDTRAALSELANNFDDDSFSQDPADLITAPDDGEWSTDDEGANKDSEGGVFLAAVRELLSTRSVPRVRKDNRAWKRRREALDQAWQPLFEPLADAYLAWKYGSVNTSTRDSNLQGSPTSDEYDFDIEILDVYTLQRSAHIHRQNHSTSPLIDLVHAGFLGATPIQPSLAISIRTLELLRVIRLHRASFSVEAFTRVLCYLNQLPYRRYYRAALSDSFDTYLTIHRIIQCRVDQALGHDTPNYRVLNSCPACCYELEDEPSLPFTRLFAMDGNNSLKRLIGINTRATADRRVFEESDYYLSRNYVDQFANEVKARPRSDEDPDDEDDDTLSDGDPTDGGIQSGCTDNWKAAAADAKKRTWEIFDEAGIFAAACRHGLILWLADIVRSGELAKYPLAIIRKALDTLKPRWLCGYDIACSFDTTISTVSLASDFRQSESRFCVNAFHGYAHNFLCQLQFHPTNVSGTGLEDLETMERVFSSSNSLASVIRYMSAYRRRVFIDMHFRAWDAEKYVNLSTFILNNYLQARDVIDELEQDIAQSMQSLNLTPADLEQQAADQLTFFQNVGKETEEDLHAIVYVELLEELQATRRTYENLSSRFRLQTPTDYHFVAPDKSYSINLSATRKTESEKRHLGEKIDRLTSEITQLEAMMNISSRWQPTDVQYMKTLTYLSQRDYEKALDKLQKLVTFRLFELQKMNLSQTAYKMRVYIAKSLQKRSKAIRRAVQAYNKAAIKLNPPKPTLDWDKVNHYSFLDEFDILRTSEEKLKDQSWSQTIVRDLIKRFRRLQRAQEEIQRCHVEVRRLHTSIIDETAHFDKLLVDLQTSPLLGPVQEYITRRSAANTLLLTRIQQIHNVPAFTGDTSLGTLRGSMQVVREKVPEAPKPPEDENEAEEADDEHIGQVGNVVDYIARLSV